MFDSETVQALDDACVSLLTKSPLERLEPPFVACFFLTWHHLAGFTMPVFGVA